MRLRFPHESRQRNAAPWPAVLAAAVAALALFTAAVLSTHVLATACFTDLPGLAVSDGDAPDRGTCEIRAASAHQTAGVLNATPDAITPRTVTAAPVRPLAGAAPAPKDRAPASHVIQPPDPPPDLPAA